ncbi:DUF459 domain-containing protein [Sphingomonas canadensis]|uniref:DUF459 domain-containing protein n=2 Tax=Sphingomonas canadensis TaxID=1219257 RepID=A0ABW3H7Y6_9SPHN|nr:DUF459 domain-containing protein [Sphingomonas canadensis]
MRGKLAFLADRTAVLFLGLAAGAFITASFYTVNAPVAPPAAPQPGAPAGDQPGAPAVPAAALPPTVTVGPALASTAAAGREVHVGVFGDSFGDGIWAALYNGLRKDDTIKVHQFSERSTGFTRYRSLNLLDDIRGKIDRQPVDIAVISFGANDTQGIYDNGHAAKFMSEDWQKIVGDRVAAIVTMLRERGAQVYWVGLPRMRKPEFDADIQQLNAFFAARARALNVPFIDTVPASVDADGKYAPYLRNPDTGERVMARANDGIHMTMSGYGFLIHGLTGDIQKSIAQARGAANRDPARQDAGKPAGEAAKSDG